MKQILFMMLIFSHCVSVFAQAEKENPPIADPDCIFEAKLTWKEEKIRLYSFERELNNEKDSVGLIIFYLDKKISENRLRIRLNKVLNHIENIGKIDRSRLRLVLVDYIRERTCHFVMPKSESPDCKNCLISSGDDKFKNFKLFPNKPKK